MAFDVNSLGGKLIDNQNLAKALAEGGGGSGGLVVHMNITGDESSYTVTFDKTYRQIVNAIENGVMPVLLADDDGGYSLDTIAMCYPDSGEYAIQTNSNLTFRTATEDGYPAYTHSEQH